MTSRHGTLPLRFARGNQVSRTSSGQVVDMRTGMVGVGGNGRRVSVMLGVLLLSLVVVPGNPAQAASRRYVVTAAVVTNNLLVSDQFTMTGSVAPAAPGKKVLVQRKSGRHWHTVAKGKLDAASHFRIGFHQANPGAASYRVVKARHGRVKKGASPVVTVRAWRWESITASQIVERDGWFDSSWGEYGVTQTDGVMSTRTLSNYMHAIGVTAYADLVLGRKCDTLRALVGLDDGSPSDGTMRVQVIGDGATRWQRDFALGAHAGLNLNVRGVLRLRLADTTIGKQGATVNYGNLSARCTR